MNIEVTEPELMNPKFINNNFLSNIIPFVIEFQGNPFCEESAGIKEDQNSYFNNINSINKTWMSTLPNQHKMSESKGIVQTDDSEINDNQNAIDREIDKERYENSIQNCIKDELVYQPMLKTQLMR